MVKENIKVSGAVFEEVLYEAAIKKITVDIQLFMSVDHVLILEWITRISHITVLNLAYCSIFEVRLDLCSRFIDRYLG